MAQKLDENEMVSFKDLLMANSTQVDSQGSARAFARLGQKGTAEGSRG